MYMCCSKTLTKHIFTTWSSLYMIKWPSRVKSFLIVLYNTAQCLASDNPSISQIYYLTQLSWIIFQQLTWSNTAPPHSVISICSVFYAQMLIDTSQSVTFSSSSERLILSERSIGRGYHLRWLFSIGRTFLGVQEPFGEFGNNIWNRVTNNMS